MMDLSNLAIGGVAVVGLIIGIVEGLKDFGVTGKWSKVAAFGTSLVLAGIALAVSSDMIAARIVPYIELTVRALAFALAATGYYDFVTKKVLKQ